VSNGDPWVISSVYNVARRSTSLSDIPKNIQSLMYSLNWDPVLLINITGSEYDLSNL